MEDRDEVRLRDSFLNRYKRVEDRLLEIEIKFGYMNETIDELKENQETMLAVMDKMKEFRTQALAIISAISFLGGGAVVAALVKVYGK